MRGNTHPPFPVERAQTDQGGAGLHVTWGGLFKVLALLGGLLLTAWGASAAFSDKAERSAVEELQVDVALLKRDVQALKVGQEAQREDLRRLMRWMGLNPDRSQ